MKITMENYLKTVTLQGAKNERLIVVGVLGCVFLVLLARCCTNPWIYLIAGLIVIAMTLMLGRCKAK